MADRVHVAITESGVLEPMEMAIACHGLHILNEREHGITAFLPKASKLTIRKKQVVDPKLGDQALAMG